MFSVVSVGGGGESHLTPDMFKVDHLEACMIGKRAVGILLERFRVQFETVLLESYYYRPQRSWGKVMFLQVCVILFTGGGEYLTSTPPDQVHPPGTRYTPLTRYTSPRTRYTPPDQVHPPSDQVHPSPPGPGRYGLRAGGMHPTGMQSCFRLILPSLSIE